MKLKRFILCAIIAALCFTLAGCGDSGPTGSESSPSATIMPSSSPAETDANTTETRSPGIPQTSASENMDPQLIGRWEFDSGMWIWFFGTSNVIEFFADGKVTQMDTDNPGDWETVGVGRLDIYALNTPNRSMYSFNYILEGDLLTIYDSDGDSATWVREGGTRPNRNTGEIDPALVGRWEFTEGAILFFFAQGDDIEFFDNGKVLEHAYGESGDWYIVGEGSFIVDGDWTGIAAFTYSLSGIDGDTLIITDEAGDSATWRKS